MTKRLSDTMSWEEITDKIIADTDSKRVKGFRDWLLTKKNYGGSFFNSNTYLLCYKIMSKINPISLKYKNDDHVLVITGLEGSGKSTLAIQIACIVDPLFTRQRIPKNRYHFYELVKVKGEHSRKGGAIILDEGNLFFMSREAMSPENKRFLKVIAQCRQANQLIIVCVPKYSTIDGYIREHRVNGLMRITKQGCFIHYNRKGALEVHEKMKKGIPIEKINVNDKYYYRGNWNKYLPEINDISYSQYESDKNKNYDEFINTVMKQEKDTVIESPFLSVNEFIGMTKMKRDTVYDFIKKGKIEAKQYGKKWYIFKDNVLGRGTVGGSKAQL